MQVSFLVRGDDTLRGFREAVRPSGVDLQTGLYHADGGDLYCIDFIYQDTVW